MRITIDLEQSELAAAQKLLELLKSLSDQVQVRANGVAAGGQEAAGPSSAAPLALSVVPPADAAGGPGALAPSPNVLTPGSVPSPDPTAPPTLAAGLARAPTATGPSPAPPAQQAAPAAAPAGVNGHAPAAPTPSPAAGAAAPPAAGGPALPAGVATFANILRSFTDGSQQSFDQMLAQLTATLASRRPDSVAEMADAFELVVCTCNVAQPSTILSTHRLEQYFSLLDHKLPADDDSDFRKAVLSKIVRRMQKESDQCSRVELWPLAVGFARIVKCEGVKVSGALTTIKRFLEKPASLPGGITMMVRVLEVAGQLVLTAIPELSALWATLDGLATSTPDFTTTYAHELTYLAAWRNYYSQYNQAPTDLHFQPQLPPGAGGAPAGAAPAAANGSGGGAAPQGNVQWSIQQVAAMQLVSGANTVVWDAASASALTILNDGVVSVWDAYHGTEKLRLDNAAAGHPPVSLLSSHGRSGLVLMGGNPAAHQAQSGSSYLTLHDTVNSPNLNVRAALVRRPGTSLSSVLMLPREVEACVSCEVQQSGGAAPTYPVCVWKVGQLAQAAAGVEELTPLFTSPDAHGTAVCAAAVSGLDSNAFFTGAMDGVVRVFDVRARQPVGSLLTSNMQPAAAHTGGQGLRLESNGHLLMTGGGTDGLVNIWDIRALGQAAVLSMMMATPGTRLFKLAFQDSPSPTLAALSLASGLYLLDWSTGAAGTTMIPCPGYHDIASMPTMAQLDIAWAPTSTGSTSLLGVGANPAMSMFAVQSTPVA